MKKAMKIGCIATAIYITMLFCGVPLVYGLVLIGDKLGGGASYVNPEGLSDRVPPMFGSLFTEASQKSHVPAAMIAAIYLTEHHTDSFGKDLSSLDQKLSPCTENSSGAAGPMQFIPKSWAAVRDELQGAGISNPDRCKYRDSIIGAGFLLYGKSKYSEVRAVCKKKNGNYVMTDACISVWGQSYCGLNACNDSACSNSHYRYCDEVVRKYKLVAG